jgi:hypothetical protein
MIVARAERLREEEQELSRKRTEVLDRQTDALNRQRALLKSVLSAWLDELAERLALEPQHIAVGDTCVFNRYNLPGSESSCCDWFGGAGTFLYHAGPLSQPALCRIDSVYVDKSLAQDRVDRWIENTLIQVQDPVIIKALYLDWHSKLGPRNKLSLRNHGLYVAAKFTPIDIEFKPEWGLDAGSFLKLGTEPADCTVGIWRTELDLMKKRAKLKDFEQEFETKREALLKKFGRG